MVGTTSSSPSCGSFSSFDDVAVKSNGAVKFVCSYGGKILPRYPDGKLRYVGGEIRVIAVDRSVSYEDLMAKLGELSGWGNPSLRCQLLTEDLDALVSITSDEDLANLIEEYDLANRERANPLKIRAFLYETQSPSKSMRKTRGKSLSAVASPLPARFSGGCYVYGSGNQGNRYQQQHYLVHHGNYWQ